MKFKEFLKNLFVNVKDGVSRFLVAFICSALGFLAISFEIIFETNSDEIIVPLCMTCGLVAVFSVLLKLVQEYLCEKISSVIQYILCGITFIVGFILLKANYASLYMIMSYTGIIIAMICFIFFILMRGENSSLAFPKLVTSLIFTGAICGVLSAGLSTCIAAVQFLFLDLDNFWDNFYKVYLIVNLFVWVICFVNIFLSAIPKKDVAIPQSKIFRAFVLFAGLPLYMLLIVILLAYLAKIVITWNMPVGEINWFASFASLFFIFFLLSVMQYTEKIAKLFVKFGGYFLVPVLIMQAIAVFERINAYGLTTPRTVSLVLIIISILFIIGSIIIPKHSNKVALLSGIIVLIVTITPFNIIDMPVKSQTNILKTTLESNGMIENDVVIPNENVSEEDKEKILSSYEYLKYDAKKVPDFIPDSNKTEKEIFGFTKNYDREGNSYTYCSYKVKNTVNISEYDTMIQIFESNNPIDFEHNGQQYEIDIKQIVKDLYTQYGAENNEMDIYPVNDNIALYYNNFRCDIENDEVTNYYYNGYVLIKD